MFASFIKLHDYIIALGFAIVRAENAILINEHQQPMQLTPAISSFWIGKI